MEIKKPIYEKPDYSIPRRTMPKTVNDYLTQHKLHNATREQCLQHLRDKGYMSLLPTHLMEK